MLRTSSIFLALLAVAQSPPPPAARPGLDIALERKTADGKIQSMAPDHVFEPGDVIRFRVKSEFDGYLYVMDQGSSGSFATVFPSQKAGADNSIHRGQNYLLPATEES